MKQIIKKVKKTIRKNINIRSTKKNTHTFILKPGTKSTTIWQKTLELDLMTLYIYAIGVDVIVTCYKGIYVITRLYQGVVTSKKQKASNLLMK